MGPQNGRLLVVNDFEALRIRARVVALSGSRVTWLEECPSWREASSDVVASEISVATVLRNVWGVTHSKPVSLRVRRQRRSMLTTWCQVPLRVAKTASFPLGVANSRRTRSNSAANRGRTTVRRLVSVFRCGLPVGAFAGFGLDRP